MEGPTIVDRELLISAEFSIVFFRSSVGMAVQLNDAEPLNGDFVTIGSEFYRIKNGRLRFETSEHINKELQIVLKALSRQLMDSLSNRK